MGYERTFHQHKRAVQPTITGVEAGEVQRWRFIHAEFTTR